MIHLARSLVFDGIRDFLVPAASGWLDLCPYLWHDVRVYGADMLTATEIGATRRCDVSELIINKLSRTM
jgi:hypothetical protein